jgi:hypothetical protein
LRNQRATRDDGGDIADTLGLLVTALIATGITIGAAAPAFAKPDIPVTVTGNGNGGVCVNISYEVPQCVDLGRP